MKNFEERFEQLKKNSTPEQILVLNSQKDLFNYPNSTEMVMLPSKGKFYPEGHPLHNIGSVEIKEMTAKEEDILTNKSYLRNGVLIDKLISALLIDKSIPVDTMLVGDKNAILIAARINAYGPIYDVLSNCSKCGSRNTLEIDLREIKIQKPQSYLFDGSNKDIKKTEEGNLQIVLPKTHWIVDCKIMSSTEEKKILEILENKRTNGYTPELSIVEQLELIVCSINFSKDSELLKSALDVMPAYDAKFLRDLYQKNIPNVTILKDYVCSSCLEEQELEVPFTQEFFWPK